MKTFFTRKPFAIVLLSALLSLTFLPARAQPEYYMTTPSHMSGTALSVGAEYRFYNVKPGIDAIVTIQAVSGGASVIDIDAGSGYDEAFQPDINIPANSTGYVEFHFRFVTANTNTTATQAIVNVTSIDVDGNSNYDGLGNHLHEFDEINLGGSSFYAMQLSGSELSIAQSGHWIKGTNIGGIEYPGRDTTAKSAMFTVTNYNVGAFTARIGVTNNTGSSINRQRSIYFKSFAYNQIPLSASCLRSFQGSRNSNNTQLRWQVQQCHLLDKLVIERSADGNNFQPVGEVWVDKNSSTSEGRYNDITAPAAVWYYRLRIVDAAGRNSYSNVLVFRSSEALTNFKMYPSMFRSQTAISLDAAAAQTGSLRITDYSGRVVLQRNISLSKGNNLVTIDGLGGLMQGNYIATIYADGRSQSQKIVKQ
jgi:hypothetical protein